jgi:hypothetical protein
MALASRRWVAIKSPWVGRGDRIRLADGLVPIVAAQQKVNLVTFLQPTINLLRLVSHEQ